MTNEPTKKNDQATSNDRPEEVKELPPKKVTEKDADTVKGGAGIHFKY